MTTDEAITAVEKLEPAEGDVLVFRCPGFAEEAKREKIIRALREVVDRAGLDGSKVGIAVLEQDEELVVHSPKPGDLFVMRTNAARPPARTMASIAQAIDIATQGKDRLDVPQVLVLGGGTTLEQMSASELRGLGFERIVGDGPDPGLQGHIDKKHRSDDG